LDRRQALVGLGALIVAAPAAASAAQGAGSASLDPTELDSWIAIAPDGGVTAFLGKPDLGQGIDVAIAQIVADELDVPVDRVEVVTAHTGRTINQGGASGSTAVQSGAKPLRNAAAEARRLLLEAAAARFGAPVGELEVADGVIGIP